MDLGGFRGSIESIMSIEWIMSLERGYLVYLECMECMESIDCIEQFRPYRGEGMGIG